MSTSFPGSLSFSSLVVGNEVGIVSLIGCCIFARQKQPIRNTARNSVELIQYHQCGRFSCRISDVSRAGKGLSTGREMSVNTACHKTAWIVHELFAQPLDTSSKCGTLPWRVPVVHLIHDHCFFTTASVLDGGYDCLSRQQHVDNWFKVQLPFQFFQRIRKFQQIKQAFQFEFWSNWRVEEIRTSLKSRKNLTVSLTSK